MKDGCISEASSSLQVSQQFVGMKIRAWVGLSFTELDNRASFWPRAISLPLLWSFGPHWGLGCKRHYCSSRGGRRHPHLTWPIQRQPAPFGRISRPEHMGHRHNHGMPALEWLAMYWYHENAPLFIYDACCILLAIIHRYAILYRARINAFPQLFCLALAGSSLTIRDLQTIFWALY